VEPSEAAHGGRLRRFAADRNAGIRGTGGAADTVACGVHDRTGRPPWQAADLLKRCSRFLSGRAKSRTVGVGVLIQISPQLRILVAIEAIDGRKGIDSLAQLCREKLAADPFSGCLFIFRSRSGKAIRILTYDGQGFWIATKRLSKGRFKWWPTGNEPAKTLRAHQAQLLLAAGNPDTDAAPVWRRVSA
jgi:transposase